MRLGLDPPIGIWRSGAEEVNITYLGEVADAADVQVQVDDETSSASSGAFTSVDIDLAWVLYNYDL